MVVTPGIRSPNLQWVTMHKPCIPDLCISVLHSELQHVLLILLCAIICPRCHPPALDSTLQWQPEAESDLCSCVSFLAHATKQNTHTHTPDLHNANILEIGSRSLTWLDQVCGRLATTHCAEVDN